jgi:hypothetical protein
VFASGEGKIDLLSDVVETVAGLLILTQLERGDFSLQHACGRLREQ